MTQLLSLTLPPFGFMLGTTIILPVLIWLNGKNNKIQYENILWTILVFYLISRTLDWYIAPGTHDSTGIALMIMMSIFATITMIGISIIFLIHKNIEFKETKTYIILIFLLIIPIIHIMLLNRFCNQNLNVTNKTLYEYLKN
ncbi:hypothetical protein SAMN05421738_10510 [Algoriella xinjiangensis]|uniref:Uncharacterized protein n=1 Tax=Algoriella xinjiangensis TaxID=684065 RepID=A0A1I4V9D6_9FLAO|nr:hypothetical protein [Algoriella xinjiangensis]SFM97761.1 hypothetical protein SAMN05421738_10510 [Algoriella xinjiangensis]VDH17051.1 Uncharacterised protein [Algoriella xinjiangensis]